MTLEKGDLIELDVDASMWERFFTVAPLVLVGTQEENGDDDLAPKHMAMPLGWAGHYGFVCTPAHNTYWNAKRAGEFAVSYPRPTQVVMASLAASPRDDEECKPSLRSIPTFPATRVAAPLLADGYLFLECRLDRVVDGFGDQSLIIGKIVAAHARADALRQSDADDQDMLFRAPLLSYLHPGRFANVRRTQAFPFVGPEKS